MSKFGNYTVDEVFLNIGLCDVVIWSDCHSTAKDAIFPCLQVKVGREVLWHPNPIYIYIHIYIEK